MHVCVFGEPHPSSPMFLISDLLYNYSNTFNLGIDLVPIRPQCCCTRHVGMCVHVVTLPLQRSNQQKHINK